VSFAGLSDLLAALPRLIVNNMARGPMRFAIEAGCVPGTIKLLHCGLADRAKEGPGQRSNPYSLAG
jgi:hypothetical protein